MSKAARRVERAAWILILGGLLAGGLGLAVLARDAALGWALVAAAAGAVVAGLVLIWVRSRMTDPT